METEDLEENALLKVGDFIRETAFQVRDCKNSIAELIKAIDIMNRKINDIKLLLISGKEKT